MLLFLAVQRTDQVNPAAWAASFFESCDVTVEPTEGQYLFVYVIAVYGMITLVACSSCYCIWKRERDQLARAAELPPPPPSDSWSRSARHLHPSSETQRLLPVPDGNKKDDSDLPKKKKRAQHYQPVMEYGQGLDDDYNSLPQAPVVVHSVALPLLMAEEDGSGGSSSGSSSGSDDV